MNEYRIDIDKSVADDVRMKINTALKLLDDGMPNIAEDWLYKAADALQEANEKRQYETRRAIGRALLNGGAS